MASPRTRWRSSPTPDTTCPTCSGSSWRGLRPSSRSGRRRPAIPMVCGAHPFWRRFQRRVPAGRGRRHRLGSHPAVARPEPVAGGTVMIVAIIGIAINGLTAWLFASGRKGDLNIRGAYLHMAADAAVSAGVVAGRRRHPAHRLAVARPRGEPRHRGRHRVGDVGPSARQRALSLAAVPPASIPAWCANSSPAGRAWPGSTTCISGP